MVLSIATNLANLLVVLVLVLVSAVLVVQAMKPHTAAVAHMVLVLVLDMMHLPPLVVHLDMMLQHRLVVQLDSVDHHHTNQAAMAVVDMVLLVVPVSNQLVAMVLVLDSMHHHHNSHRKPLFKPMPPMLKVSSKIPTHKSFVVQQLVVSKHTHKTSKFDSSNHHLFHPQA